MIRPRDVAQRVNASARKGTGGGPKQELVDFHLASPALFGVHEKFSKNPANQGDY
jgi:hypothetical protein